MKIPDRIYVERDEETNEKRWYSTKGMGDEYVKAPVLNQSCASCVQPVEDSWTYCPYCGAQDRLSSTGEKL